MLGFFSFFPIPLRFSLVSLLSTISLGKAGSKNILTNLATIGVCKITSLSFIYFWTFTLAPRAGTFLLSSPNSHDPQDHRGHRYVLSPL